MENENKIPPETKPDVQAIGKPETGVKSAEELMAELKAEREKGEALDKRVKDQEKFIGEQSTTIGELRKKSESEKPSDTETIDDDVKEVAEDLEKRGYSKDEAWTNAELLVSFDRRRVKKRVMDDTIDFIHDALDEGKLDKTVFKENEQAIMDEFKGRKLAPTARRNFRIFKECYDIVIKRKADELKKGKTEEEERKREAQIAEGQIPPPGPRKEETPEEDKQREAIRTAGPNRSSAFF